MITTVLFDLDGTLLPMDQEEFTRVYFKELTNRMADFGIDRKELTNAIWQAMKEMVANDGSRTNEEVFWQSFCHTFGEQILSRKKDFDDFYLSEFDRVRDVCGMTPKAAGTVEQLRRMGLQTAVATLPVFPLIGIEARLRWAGVSPEDFAFITSYETSHYTKPNPAYYRELLEQNGLTGEECLMVGNNVEEDMRAADLGIKVFLLTDCLINEKQKDISLFPNGGFDALMDYLRTLL